MADNLILLIHTGSGADGGIAGAAQLAARVWIDRDRFHWEMAGVRPQDAMLKLRQVHTLLAEENGWPKGGRWQRVRA